jgi:hypothetical protein
LAEENPTTGDSGASITDRLEKYLAAEVEPVKEPPQTEAQAEVKAEPEKQAAKPEPETPKEGEQTESQQPQLSTTDLAKILGIDESAIDVDGDGNISVKTKIDGKDGAAKFTDLVKSYQLQGHAENKARAVAEQEKALQARTQEVEQAFKQRLDHAESLAKLAAEELMSEYQQYDWKALDQHPDQGAVAALKLKFQERNAKIQNALQGINGHRAQLGKQAEEQRAKRVEEEAARLPTLIPEWKDQAVASKEAQAIREWGMKVGYSAQDLAALDQSSALHVATVRKAMLFDQLQQSKSVVENKVRLAPKIVKPGQAEQDGPAQKLRDLKEQVKKSGGKGGSLEALLIARGTV